MWRGSSTETSVRENIRSFSVLCLGGQCSVAVRIDICCSFVCFLEGWWGCTCMGGSKGSIKMYIYFKSIFFVFNAV